MREYTSGMDALRAICEVLGLNPTDHPITRITIEFTVHDPPKAIISRFITAAEFNRVVEVFTPSARGDL